MENNIQETTNQTSEETPKKVNWMKSMEKRTVRKKARKDLLLVSL